MSALGGFLALLLVAAILIGGAWLCLAGVLHLLDTVWDSSDRPVMPAHYSSLVHTNGANYPGYCTECGTANDPAFDLCRNCASRLPRTDAPETDWDTEDVFGH